MACAWHPVDLRSSCCFNYCCAVRWLLEWTNRRRSDPWIPVAEMRSVLGRLGFVAGVLIHSRPLLGPVYAWCAAVHNMRIVRMPPVLLLIMDWFARK
eukprot:1247884-Amphidinium_carterae.1